VNHWLILGIGAFVGTVVGVVIGALCNAAHDGDGCRECRREGELAAQLVEMNEGEHEPEPEDAILADTGAIVALIEEAHALADDCACDEERRAFLRRVMAEQVTDEAVAYDDWKCAYCYHPGIPCCCANSDEGLLCTRKQGHGGYHVACGGDRHPMRGWFQAESVALHAEAVYE
jgi:hypothetical protein